MVISVYHKTEDQNQESIMDWPRKARLIAVVEADTIDQAVSDTIHVQKPTQRGASWTDNSNIVWVDQDYETNPRSTKVGDFLVDDRGRHFIVERGLTTRQFVPAQTETIKINGKYDHAV